MNTVPYEKMRDVLFGVPTDLRDSDPEFVQLFSKFAFAEVPEDVCLDAATAYLAVLSSLMGCGGVETFARLAAAAVSGPLAQTGLTPVQLREMVYQGTAYLGIGRTLPFLEALQTVLREAGIEMPLPEGKAATDRLAGGEAKQMEIFGPQMKGFASSGPQESRHINKWLVDNCFGDYYTRLGLNNSQREMITFCFLAAQGGCEAQLKAHITANVNVGNDRRFLIGVISVCLPYIGYPRSLNALRCVQETAPEDQNQPGKEEER